MQDRHILKELQKVLIARKGADAGRSYVAGLYAKGLDHILKKIGEESSEVIIAAKGIKADELVKETADLWFHCMVLLAAKDIDVSSVLHELETRFGTSGLAEKAGRRQR